MFLMLKTSGGRERTTPSLTCAQFDNKHQLPTEHRKWSFVVADKNKSDTISMTLMSVAL